MSKVFLYFIVLIVAFLPVSCRKKSVFYGGGHETALPKVIETEPPVLLPVSQEISANIKGYYQALPAHYQKTAEKYPVIIYFHGGGQYGNGAEDLPQVLEDGVPKLLDEKKFPPSFTVNGETF